MAGMGEVYRATDTRLERTVAVKILPEAFATDPQWKSRFGREAQIISSLDHPHICGLYDVGTEQGIDFLVMQYLEGQTLAERLTRGALDLRSALQIAVQLAAGLAAAHRAGVVHRDLKPANVMLTKAGVKLLDFGLAKPSGPPLGGSDHPAPTMTRTSPLTAAGSIMGTLQYMAPEQLEGGEADPRTDIFALGLMIYEMITGRAAFTANSQAGLIATILTQDPPPLVTVEPLTPAMLDAVVRRCLAKDREERWQSAQDLLAQLQWLLDNLAPRFSSLRLFWVSPCWRSA